MGDYEAIPSAWGWLPAATPPDITAAVTDEGARLISIHRPDGGAQTPYTAVWVKNDDSHSWDWTPQALASGLDQAVADANGRLIFIDPFNPGRAGDDVRFAAIWVENTGEYKRTWGWSPDLTASEVRAQANISRLICLSPYWSGGKRLYAAVWVDNSGANFRKWDWDLDISFDGLLQRLDDFPGRLVSLDPFLDGGQVRFAAIWVDAVDEFNKLWWWQLPSDADTVSLDCELFCSHLVEIRTIPGTPGQYAHFRHGFPRPQYAESATLVSVSGTASISAIYDTEGGFGQNADLDLKLTNLTDHEIEITSADVLSTYSGWATPEASYPMFSGEIPVLGGKSTTMGASAQYAGSATYFWSGATHLVARIRAEDSTGETQYLVKPIKITRTSYLSPAPLKIKAPVFLGIWTSPLEILPLWLNGSEVRWLMIGGAVLNGTGTTLRIGGLHATVRANDDIVADRELNYEFRHFVPPAFDDFEPVPPPVNAHAELPSVYSYFIDGLELPADLDLSGGCQVELVLNYKIGDWCGMAIRRVSAALVDPVSIRTPVKGTWNWGNGLTHLGFDTHASPGERFCFDFTVLDANGQTFTGESDDNASFYAYGKEVYAVRGGTVVKHKFTVTDENHGYVQDGAQETNYVLLSHDQPGIEARSGYYHLQPKEPDPNQAMQDGDSVTAGQLIGYVGNSGGTSTSEPHLHFGYVRIDPTGRQSLAPVAPRRTKTTGGTLITGLPSSAQYSS